MQNKPKFKIPKPHANFGNRTWDFTRREPCSQEEKEIYGVETKISSTQISIKEIKSFEDTESKQFRVTNGTVYWDFLKFKNAISHVRKLLGEDGEVK